MARTKNRTNYGVLFWIASILLISVLYIANHQNIQRVLERTRFMEVVFEGEEEATGDETTEPAGTPEPPAEERELPALPEAASDPEPAVEEIPETEESESAAEEELVLDIPEEETEPVYNRTMTAPVFFIRVSDDGRILPEPVDREVRFSNSPLTRTIESLLAGPNADALNRGLLNLIPEGTMLRSARIEGNVAYLDFNEQFRFNPIGMEGFLAQLQQVVYTATAFSSIGSVQILIEGEILDYLGGEGVYIGAPLTRDAFRT